MYDRVILDLVHALDSPAWPVEIHNQDPTLFQVQWVSVGPESRCYILYLFFHLPFLSFPFPFLPSFLPPSRPPFLPFFFPFFLFFFGHACDMWKVWGQGSNLLYSNDLSHRSDARSLSARPLGHSCILFLTNCQVVLKLLVQGPRSENH